MSLRLYCPKIKSGGTVDILRCIFLCPKGTVIQCPEYTRVYLTAKEYQIPEQYKEKYGEPQMIVPLKYWKRRKRGG